MKIKLISLLTFFSVTANGSDLDSIQWKKLKTEKFEIIYPSGLDVSETLQFLKTGTETVENFFGQPFSKKFYVKIFVDRNDLDKFWRTDWNAPDFNSECWMVASGDAKGIAMLATSAWKVQACEHDPADKTETQKLLTHELTHVFHSQWQNAGANEDLEPIGWFVEGLATYVSGQLDDRRMSQVREASRQGKIPKELEKFWRGQARYGQSGSLVQWIDKTYGRKAILQLLGFTKENQFLALLKISESQLIENWKTELE